MKIKNNIKFGQIYTHYKTGDLCLVLTVAENINNKLTYVAYHNINEDKGYILPLAQFISKVPFNVKLFYNQENCYEKTFETIDELTEDLKVKGLLTEEIKKEWKQ
ncbi:hypothetical protein [Peptostreptococcus equinus]|uniref:DUF1653 domain-containing protein n=1 Tax=Peptostreptococcus equinus TaxID=3003601 RepID=A0ABY7JN07_9FIRM|nr:hypothetical protein [Peptostreptococcus sp. CBA3647]WAW14756.1 hypothetical protein O0R46_09245 [Peptostreptococcus sp. CBA3647]